MWYSKSQIYEGSEGEVRGVDRAGKMGYANANTNIINIPIHQVGKLVLNTASAEFILSEMDPALFATKAPRNSPIIVIITVDVVNNNNVLGIFSIMISRTLEDPDSEVKK
jgi:hypothetical protein